MNTSEIERYTLKQYTRLMISFFGCLLVLSIYQFSNLYFKGVIDGIFSASFLIMVVHQIGFASLMGVIFAFPFNFWEKLRPKYGFNLVFILLSLVLIVEAVLIGYYCTALVPLGPDLFGVGFGSILDRIIDSGGMSLSVIITILITIGLFLGFYRISSKFYHRISKMYPFTIILFSMFIATLFLEGKPINQNKTQYLTKNLYELFTENKVPFNNQSIFSSKNEDFTDGEIVWINSVYNGRNFDELYDIAKDKAYEKEFDKALLLCRYILSETPSHIDTKVLSGRVNIWQGNTEISIKILKSCIKTNPDYIDSYSALFDVYFWSGRSEEALALIEQVERNGSDIEVITDKIARAHRQDKTTTTTTNTTKQKSKAELASED